jgi:hypothetical protein
VLLMSDDGRRTRAEQWKLYQHYRMGEPWYIPERESTMPRSLTQAERIDQLERDLKMGKYAEGDNDASL